MEKDNSENGEAQAKEAEVQELNGGKKQKSNEKPMKPRDLLERMYVEIHSELASKWYMGDVERELQNIGAHLSVTKNLYDEQLIMWSRWNDKHLTTEQDVKKALYIVTADNMANLIEDKCVGFEILQATEFTNCDITLVVFGLKDYYKTHNSKFGSKDPTDMTDDKLLSALTGMLIINNVDTIHVNTANELALTIVQMTRAVAEAPYKLEKHDSDSKASFYMRGDNKNCVAVDKDGNGLAGAWQQMLAVLPNSSLEISRAIVAKYPSPCNLFENLDKEDGEAKLSELGVSRTGVPGAKARKLGPVFARKLKILFTEKNGKKVIE